MIELIPREISEWEVLRSHILLYIHHNPGCTKTEAMENLKVTERTWTDQVSRFSGIFALYQNRGWYTTKNFETRELPRIQHLEWERDLRDALQSLASAAAADNPDLLTKAAANYRTLLATPVSSYSPSHPVHATRIELLLEF